MLHELYIMVVLWVYLEATRMRFFVARFCPLGAWGFEHQMESIDNRHSQTVWENWRVLKAPELGILFWAGGGLKGGMETVTLSTKFIIFFLCSQQKIKKTYTPCKTKALGPGMPRMILEGNFSPQCEPCPATTRTLPAPRDHPGSSNGGHNGGLVVFESKKSDQRKAPHLRVRPHRCIPLGDHPVRGPAWDPTRAAWRSHSRGGFLWPQESSMFLIRKISIIGWSVRTCDLACLHMNVFLDLCARFDLAKSAKFGSKTIRVGHGWFLGTPHSWATATVIFCFKTIAHGHVPTRRNDQKKAALGVGYSMDIYGHLSTTPIVYWDDSRCSKQPRYRNQSKLAPEVSHWTRAHCCSSCDDRFGFYRLCWFHYGKCEPSCAIELWNMAHL
jgi:hypothetical protein